MLAIIDADPICYEFGNMKDLETGELLPWNIVRTFVDERIARILEATEATDSVLYLTDSKSNFRNSVATILPYKGNRTADKPKYWKEIREHLVDNYGAEVCYGIEADDACGIKQVNTAKGADLQMINGKDIYNYSIICSRDKDLQMIPGWHYSWECGSQKERKWFINETDAIRFFYKQLLTGDSTDNILGLFGVGEKASCVKAIDTMTSEQDMLSLVFGEYTKRFGTYAYEFLIENAKLLWILREYPYLDRDDADNISKRFRAEIEAEDRIRSMVLDEKVSEEVGDATSIQDEDREGQDKV